MPTGKPIRLNRRRFVAGLAAGGLLASAPRAPAAEQSANGHAPIYFAAGYSTGFAFRHGRPVVEDPEMGRALPPEYDGTITMMTRIGTADDPEVRALYPLRGHQILVAPDRRSVLFVGMNDPGLASVDFTSLDLQRIAKPHDEGFLFGGHACFSADGRALFVAERRTPDRPFGGTPQAHFGRITVRDPRSLAVIDRLDCFGIAPHEIALMPDGRHLAVANYGSTGWPSDMGDAFSGLPFGVEPSVTVIDSETGRLAAKLVAPDPRQEMRHLAALGGARIAAVPVRPTSFEDAQRSKQVLSEVYEPDRTDHLGRGYLPTPLLHVSLAEPEPRVTPIEADPPALMQRGQSIVYDPIHDEALVTYPTTHAVAVIDGRGGAVKQIIRTDRLGLRRPRGIALLPDRDHYAVSGHWRDIYVFRRGTHALQREACRYLPLFGHSHLTAV